MDLDPQGDNTFDIFFETVVIQAETGDADGCHAAGNILGFEYVHRKSIQC